MAKRRKNSYKVPKNFFLNSDLHRVLRVNRSLDLMVAWNFSERKRQGYSLSDSMKRMEKAYRIVEVEKLLNRTRRHIMMACKEGKVRYPQHSYTLGGNPQKVATYFFREEDILELHDYFVTQHIGRPRKDGKVYPGRGLPSRLELKAMMHQEETMYVKTESGEFVPVFREIDW